MLTSSMIKLFKPWPNRLANRRKFGTCAQLVFRLATHLRRLATTCVDFGRAQIWTQVDASFFYRLATQRKSTQVICCYKNALTNDMREIYGFLRLASPFGQGFMLCKILCFSSHANIQTYIKTCKVLAENMSVF